MAQYPNRPMEETGKINRFKEAFERGQRGDVGSFDVWLKEHGFAPKRVNRDYLTDYFRSHPDEAVDHQEEIDAIAEYVGFASQHDGTYHLPVVGATGVGKTQLLHTISHLLSQIELDADVQILDATTFGEKGDRQFNLLELTEELSQLDDAVLLVDNCGADKRIGYSLEELNQTVDNGLIVSVWEPEAWRRDHDTVDETLPITQEVHLEPFDETTMVTALATFFGIVSQNDYRPSEGYLKKLSKYSYGIPLLGILLTVESLREAFLKEMEVDDEAAVESATEKLDLVAAQELVYDLSDTKLTILKHLLLSYDSRGTRPSRLVDILDRDKSTISYHLRTLSDENIVNSDKEGRQVFYRVREELKPLLQIRIDEEGRLHG